LEHHSFGYYLNLWYVVPVFGNVESCFYEPFVRQAWLDEARAEFLREIFAMKSSFSQRVSVKQATPERAAT
jgi:hypothetical protein